MKIAYLIPQIKKQLNSTNGKWQMANENSQNHKRKLQISQIKIANYTNGNSNYTNGNSQF